MLILGNHSIANEDYTRISIELDSYHIIVKLFIFCRFCQCTHMETRLENKTALLGSFASYKKPFL